MRHRKIGLSAEVLRTLTATDLRRAAAGYLCTDSCDTCWSLFLTCQGNTCTAAVAMPDRG